MSIWMELRCENRSGAVTGSEVRGCHSHQNGGPMELCDEDSAAVTATLKDLLAEARFGATPWYKTKAGMICPVCAGVYLAT